MGGRGTTHVFRVHRSAVSDSVSRAAAALRFTLTYQVRVSVRACVLIVLSSGYLKSRLYAGAFCFKQPCGFDSGFFLNLYC